MPEALVTQSNVFGVTSTSNTAGTGPDPSLSVTNAAAKMIEHLKWVADNAITSAANRANWLGIAANAGQNTDSRSMVRGELLAPTPLNRSTALARWDLQAISATPLTLPTLPENLKIDMGKLKVDLDADIARLQNAWFAKYLPALTDMTALDNLSKNVLNGTNANEAKAKLDALEADTRALLKAVTDSAMSTLEARTITVSANLSTNFSTAGTAIASALDVAKDNTNTIAWVRARDQAAREGARQEREAIAGWSGRGFTLPGGALTAQLQRARQATQDAGSAMAAEQAVKSQQFFFDVARATVDAWLRKMDSQATAEIAIFREIVGAKLKAAELELDANKFKARQAFEHLGLTLDFTKFSAELAVKYRLGILEAMNNLVRVYAGLRGTETEYLNALARAEVQAQTAVLDYYKAAMSAAEIGMRVDVTNNENDLRWANIAAQFLGTAVGHHVQAAAEAAKVFGQTAGMALTGLQGIASIATTA